MILLLTALMAVGMIVQCVMIGLTTHWHHQDRKQIAADEKQIAYEQSEIEVLQHERNQTPG